MAKPPVTQHNDAANAEDAALVARVAVGDARAFGALYDRYASLLLGLGVRLLSNRAEAEDVLHDVFVEVHKRAGDFDAARGTVRTWLALRMRSRCLDRQKSPRVSRSVAFDDSEASRRAAPEHDPLLRLQRERVRAALATLPAEQRVVVELAYFHGLSTQAIGERTGTPQGTVKSRLFAARDKLARALVDADALSATGGRRDDV
ncbi:MAG TPA: sigma-70 family RNA polymerase sigma factor [Myxococcota bacterium]